jgi:hypothetical protein
LESTKRRIIGTVGAGRRPGPGTARARMSGANASQSKFRLVKTRVGGVLDRWSDGVVWPGGFDFDGLFTRFCAKPEIIPASVNIIPPVHRFLELLRFAVRGDLSEYFRRDQQRVICKKAGRANVGPPLSSLQVGISIVRSPDAVAWAASKQPCGALSPNKHFGYSLS